MNNYIKRADRFIRSCCARSLSSILPGVVAAGYYRIANFGDLITPDILRYFGLHPVHCPRIGRSDVVGAGSLLQMLSSSYKGVILGSGLINRVPGKLFDDADVMLVRGHLTKSCCSMAADVPVGDPGLIADVVYEQSIEKNKRWDIGFIPHYSDLTTGIVQWLMKHHQNGVHIIDVREPPERVISGISKCRVVVSSSLHGLIFADSLGIPNVWVKLSDKIIGGSFKFDDYYSCFGVERSPLVLTENISLKQLEAKALSLPGDLVCEVKHSITSAYSDFAALGRS